MIYDALKIMVQAFKACTNWFEQLVDATGSQFVIIAAVSLVVVIGMLFIPMRGGNIVAGWNDVSDFTKSKINNHKRIGGSNRKSLTSGAKQLPSGKGD